MPSGSHPPITVAINAQINPANAGGVESALHGLMNYLAEQSADERYLLLASRRYTADLERIAAGRYETLAWPFPQKAYAPYRGYTRRWVRWMGRAGPLRPAVDALHWCWWNGRRALARNPDARQTDRLFRQYGVSVVHFAYSIRFGTSLPFLYEPWDLQHRHYPDFFQPDEWRWRDDLYREGCEQAALVVAATRWTKRDIMAQYGIPAEKIAVIPRGPWLTPIMPSADDVTRTRAALNLPKRFAFYPAMSFPHKNHLRLFEALAILRDRHGIRLPLVCTGRAYEPHWPAILAGVVRFGLEGQVLLLGSVDPDTLAAIFKAATFLVFPSLFEGLGLPIIEALEYKLPVVASDATCIPEVGGDAAVYFDGTSVESIVEALLRAEREPERLARTLAAAPAALGRYSWPRAAATFVACYRSVAGAQLTPEQQALYAEAIDA